DYYCFSYTTRSTFLF
nr:immunoglobulin light chain junction region [Macaca mulatta]